MAFDLKFAAAYIDNGNTHKVLGVKLRPFCAWHLLLLQVAESPFLDNGKVYLYHLRRAVGICRLKFPRSRTRPPWGPIVMTQKKMHAEVSKFILYTNDYIHRPDYDIMPINVMSRGAPAGRPPEPPPDVIQLVYDASHGANVSIDVAWNMPIGQAYVAQAMHYQKSGLLVDFMTDDEREFQRRLKEYEQNRNNGGR